MCCPASDLLTEIHPPQHIQKQAKDHSGHSQGKEWAGSYLEWCCKHASAGTGKPLLRIVHAVNATHHSLQLTYDVLAIRPQHICKISAEVCGTLQNAAGRPGMLAMVTRHSNCNKFTTVLLFMIWTCTMHMWSGKSLILTKWSWLPSGRASGNQPVLMKDCIMRWRQSSFINHIPSRHDPHHGCMHSKTFCLLCPSLNPEKENGQSKFTSQSRRGGCMHLVGGGRSRWWWWWWWWRWRLRESAETLREGRLNESRFDLTLWLKRWPGLELPGSLTRQLMEIITNHHHDMIIHQDPQINRWMNHDHQRRRDWTSFWYRGHYMLQVGETHPREVELAEDHNIESSDDDEE